MTTYAKLNNDGTPDTLTRVPHVSNPTPDTVEAYALANGYKVLTNTPSPGTYYHSGYTETDTAIVQTWQPWPLEEARADAMERVQEWLTAALSMRATVPCEGIDAGIVYDADALINAVGMQAMGGCDAFIDAEDNVHTLDAGGVAAVTAALTAHRQGLYARATKVRTAIREASDVAAVEAALNDLI